MSSPNAIPAARLNAKITPVTTIHGTITVLGVLWTLDGAVVFVSETSSLLVLASAGINKALCSLVLLSS